MGILNVTPDSFYSGSRLAGEKELLTRAETMLTEGADILDVGGMSSRPGAEMITEEEELSRVVPVVKLLSGKIPHAIVSVDTFRAAVAEAAVREGASIINDISAGTMDAELFKTAARLKTPYVLMHMQGTPRTMQDNPHYTNVVKEVTEFFIEKLAHLKQMGLNDIILDPGFGFGKNLEHNYALLKNLAAFNIFEQPVMAGISRKSLICAALKVKPENALNGTTALHSIALLNGVNILRVHDVKEANEVIRLMGFFMNAQAVE